MLMKLFTDFAGNSITKEPEQKDDLRRLEVSVREEMKRTEEMFNLTEDDALMDTAIYRLKSLTAYQEYLLRAIRENELDDTESFIVEASQEKAIGEEGFAMG